MMELMVELWNRFRHRLRRDALTEELDRELKFHQSMLEEEQIRSGVNASDATTAARRSLGNITAIREASRDQWSFAWLEDMAHDARIALRSLRKNPGFAAVATLSLGVGIGAVTTVFSVIDTFDFRPLPYKDADRLAWISETTPKDDALCSTCSWWVASPTMHDWIARARSFDRIEAATHTTFSWEHDDIVVSLGSTPATIGLLELLGAQVQLGRSFIAADTVSGAERVVLVTDEFWRTQLGGNNNVVGTKLRSNATGAATPRFVTIVGVLPKNFHFRDETPLWMPLRINPNGSRTERELKVIGRLAAGQSFVSAATEIRTLTLQMAAVDPKAYKDWGVNVEPLRRLFTTSAAKNRFMLFAVTTLVLLIAVLNVTGLLSTRAHARKQEFAVRSALGAGRTRLLRQLIVEGLCVSLTGGIVGLLLAAAGTAFVPRWFSLNDNGLTFGISSRLIAFAGALSLMAGSLAAIGPAIRSTRADLGGSLRSRTGKQNRQTARAASVLVAAQIAVALSLLAAAVMLSREFVAMRYLDIGFKPNGLYSNSLMFNTRDKVAPERWRALADAARERISAIPGVAAVSVEHRSAMQPSVVRTDSANSWQTSERSPMVIAVNPTYFKTFGTRLLRGRELTEQDQRGSPLVAVVNAAAASRLWPQRNPVGRQIFVGDSATGEWLTVVGVTGDIERGERAEPTERHWPVVYRAFAQAPVYHAGGSIYVRIDSRSAVALGAAQAALSQITGGAVTPFRSQVEQVGRKLLERKLNAVVLDLFALFGLVLAAMGIYGSVAYAATQRTNEIGIRVALGAKRADVIAILAQRGIAVACIGVTLGVFGAFAVTRGLQSLVIATNGTSISLFLSAGMLMFATVIIATLIPAVRATRIDPVSALRAD